MEFAQYDCPILYDFTGAFRQLIVPTRAFASAKRSIGNRRKVDCVAHLSSLADLLPSDMRGNHDNQCSGLLSAAEDEPLTRRRAPVERLKKRMARIVGATTKIATPSQRDQSTPLSRAISI
jgi:hypothetical protein